MATRKKQRPLRTLTLRDVTIFKMMNRKGYAAIAKGNLCEGRTVFQAYSRLVKACKRGGYALPIRTAPQLPKPKTTL